MTSYFKRIFVKDCSCNVINVSKKLDKCEYIDLDFKVSMNRKRYQELVMDCFRKINNNSLRERLKELGKYFKGEVFLNHHHKERFYNYLQEQDLDTNKIPSRFIAILFLIIAYEGLWKVSVSHIIESKFDLKQICLKEINAEGYALYQTAKIISTGKEYIRINELVDRDLIDDYIFKVINNSVLINRYGTELFLINE